MKEFLIYGLFFISFFTWLICIITSMIKMKNGKFDIASRYTIAFLIAWIVMSGAIILIRKFL